jgi:hypothetical protein
MVSDNENPTFPIVTSASLKEIVCAEKKHNACQYGRPAWPDAAAIHAAYI